MLNVLFLITETPARIWQWLQETFNRPLFTLGTETVTLGWIVEVLVLLLLVTLAVRMIKRMLKTHVLIKLRLDTGTREAIATLMSFVIGAFGYVIVLQAVGIDLASLAVIVGGLGVGIGFGLQDVTRNLISGLILLIERKVKVGDFIEMDQIAGYISEISIRSTVIRTFQGAEVLVPNVNLADNQVTNWNYSNCHGRIDLPVGVAYGSDPVLVTEVLLNLAHSAPHVLHDPPPRVIFQGFGDSSLDFELWIWVDAIDRRIVIRSDLNFKIEYTFRQHGIEIPFPQVDLWYRNPPKLPASPNPGTEPSTDPLPSPPAFPRAPQTSLRSLLQNVSYFHCLNDLQLRSLIEMGCRKQLAKGETLFQQGERANTFCIVLGGKVAAFSENRLENVPVFVFEPGDYFGEIPLMLGVPYPTTMKAMAETVLFMLEQKGFAQLLTEHPFLGEDVAQAIAERQEILSQYQQDLSQENDTEYPNAISRLRQKLKSLLNW
ncbi:mechanosensitive ion channel [Candidatus Synechococcus calcipolaris G9]|uniref:Mechanosensitive ion channel n=1 Tax=Candidatus Synechococcus calcipolaris G9 TaxID=1497997 RepID=A0ABT6F1H1_9SYNE|nr:mechanosensitive ion channel domain-containing protein [Candidatus Synechococcus calcipolaris]MDG2991684.1 mechanosensitive ion channel [Candidatus Synechococcus calcipolaris G9]